MTRANLPLKEAHIVEALRYIDPATDRDTWANVAMAIYSGLGDAGFPIFDDWSRGASSYKERDCRDTYKSASKPGGIKVGTLFHLAKQGGYRPSGGHGAADTSALFDDEEAKERAELERVEHEAQTLAAQDAMRERWANSSQLEGSHPYLISKAIPDAKLPLRVQGANLLVPMYSPQHVLMNYQSISSNGEKRFQKGCPIKGAYFPIGGSDTEPLLICEGLATGASLALASGAQVAVAFSAGNLMPVAQAMREKHPRRRIVICADFDHEKTHAGEAAATKAALAIGAHVALPQFKEPAGKTDFNDLHKEQGLKAVKAAIDAAKPLPDDWPEPEPLDVPEAEEQPFPLETLGPLLGGAASAIVEHVQCPPAIAAFTVLGAASFAVQAHYLSFHPKRPDGMPPSLFLLALAESSERKSTAEGLALWPIQKLEQALATDFKQQQIEWKQQQKDERSKKKGTTKNG